MAASWETIKVDGSDMRMYFSIPDGSGPFPAVVISQHGPGVNEFIQDIANNLAIEGYVACAPELYHRVTEEMLADGSSAGQHLTDPGIVADINATVEFLRRHPSVDGERLGVFASPRADGGVAHMAHAQVPLQALEIGRREDVPNQPFAFLDVEAAVVGDDTCGVLSAVLNGDQPVVDLTDCRTRPDDSDEAAHRKRPSSRA